MPDEYAVHDIAVSESPHIGLSGVTQQVIVRYFVGEANGPFTDVYRKDEYTPEKARAAIDARVQGLRALGAT